MKKLVLFLLVTALASHSIAWGEGRDGRVEWSDGHQSAGLLSLSPGKDLRVFTGKAQVAVQLDEVKEMRFTLEKEEMWEGFYFPNAGQATQAKTGEVYPIRYLQTHLTLADGRNLEGHLFTTTLYVETDDATQKVVLMAKMTGTNGQKLADVIYPTSIHFATPGISNGSSQIHLADVGLTGLQTPVVVSLPDLSLLPLQPLPDKLAWTVPQGDPQRLLFSVEATDGIHVAWPEGNPDEAIQKAVSQSLKDMEDFYDDRKLLGCFANATEGDVYSLVMLSRQGTTYGFPADRKPWSLVILRWKYDTDAKKTTLLNRISLAMGRAEGNSVPPAVFKESGLLRAITTTVPTENHP